MGQDLSNIQLRVVRNFRGDVQIVRGGERVSWLDLSPDAAVSLAMALLTQAGHQRIPVQMSDHWRCLELTP